MSEKFNLLPFVSALIVFRNEEKYISQCLLSLLLQNYPKDRYEVILIDSMSTDNTLELVKKTISTYENDRNIELPQIIYLQNEKKILATGWNMGIKKAKGEFVFRIDAHAFCNTDFIMESVRTCVNNPEAGCVGGKIETVANTKKGILVAKVLSSPFGVGNSKFRYSNKPQYVDTVAFGLYRKEIFDKVGYFDESLKRNQDNDMHLRIREAGYKFFLNPAIKSTYHSRENIYEMMKQAYGNGYWNIKTFRKNPKSLSVRHMIPFIFVLSIFILSILSFFNNIFMYILFFEIFIHLFIGFVFSLKYKNKWTNVFVIPFIYIFLHISYGSGSFVSLFINGGKK